MECRQHTRFQRTFKGRIAKSCEQRGFNYSTEGSFRGSGRRKLSRRAITKTQVPTMPAAVATCSKVVPASFGATRLAVMYAAEVPSIRPPTLVAKLPPVARKCNGNTLGRYSPK